MYITFTFPWNRRESMLIDSLSAYSVFNRWCFRFEEPEKIKNPDENFPDFNMLTFKSLHILHYITLNILGLET